MFFFGAPRSRWPPLRSAALCRPGCGTIWWPYAPGLVDVGRAMTSFIDETSTWQPENIFHSDAIRRGAAQGQVTAVSMDAVDIRSFP